MTRIGEMPQQRWRRMVKAQQWRRMVKAHYYYYCLPL
jgi:hypothetical protein